MVPSIASMIRVNHAGEHGAVQIYRGQMVVLGHSKSLMPVLREMLSHEESHLEQFSALIREHRVRPTVFSPLWHIGAFALGAITAALGEKSALACTVAVEEVIDAHYETQKKYLEGNEMPANSSTTHLRNTIARCQAEEVLHKNLALQLGAEDARAYVPLTCLVRGISRAAIWLSQRF